MRNQPLVSVIMPTFNEEKGLKRCLDSLKAQDYPASKIEIIIIDDNSTDKTVEIAQQYGAVIIESGAKHIERSKSLGLAKAKGELILLMDADIRLIGKQWLSKAVQALLDNPRAIGVQAIYWQYKKGHSLVNRYCELLGVNDPFIFMLGKRGILGPHEKNWPNRSAIKQETTDYFVAEFTADNLPTLGSQGYLTRKKLLTQHTSWDPYFFHLDTVAELVSKGHNQVILAKLEVDHDYVDSIGQFYRKLKRNVQLYLKYQSLRSYTYGLGSWPFIRTVLLMVTVVVPLAQAIVGYIRKPDPAWFLHPLFCLTVPFLYASVLLAWKVGYGRS